MVSSNDSNFEKELFIVDEVGKMEMLCTAFVPQVNALLDENVEMDNRSESGENGQDQWVGGLKSKLNDRRVQYKRKRDTVGYRINPDIDDIAKSLVTPSDFKFMNETENLLSVGSIYS